MIRDAIIHAIKTMTQSSIGRHPGRQRKRIAPTPATVRRRKINPALHSQIRGFIEPWRNTRAPPDMRP